MPVLLLFVFDKNKYLSRQRLENTAAFMDNTVAAVCWHQGV